MPRATLLHEAEVDQDRFAVRAQEDVAGLQVAMDVADVVQGLHGLGHLVHEARHVAGRHRVRNRQQMFHHVIRHAVVRPRTEEARQDRKRQEANRVRLGGKAGREVAGRIDE